MKTLLLSDREADSAGYLTAAEILKGQLAGYPTGTYAHNGNEDLDRPGRPAARTVRLRLVVAACAGDDQEVFVNPADLGAGQAGQEGCDGRVQLFGGVEGEG